MSFEIDPVKYGVLWQKVENYETKFEALEKKIDKMEANIEKLLENQAKQKGAGWLRNASSPSSVYQRQRTAESIRHHY